MNAETSTAMVISSSVEPNGLPSSAGPSGSQSSGRSGFSFIIATMRVRFMVLSNSRTFPCNSAARCPTRCT
ncbi:MAG: hypothetical protein EBX95_12610 [Acidimicrobiia bacterium]|nr:hypothetical protein [Acidimicrobiia bacterium]